MTNVRLTAVLMSFSGGLLLADKATDERLSAAAKAFDEVMLGRDSSRRGDDAGGRKAADTDAHKRLADGRSTNVQETKRRTTMFRSMSTALRLFILGVGALSLAASASAQPATTKEKVAAGAPTITRKQLKGEVVAVGSNWLVARMAPTGDYRVFNVVPGKTAMIDGVPKTVSQLQKGTMLTADVTVTEHPLVRRTTTVNSGRVFWASPTSVIITQENNENRQYAVPNGFKFDVDGQQLEAMQLRPGMMLKGTKIVEEPIIEVTTDSVVTGTAPK